MDINYQSEPMVVLTDHEIIDGVLYRPEDIRFSDLMNASAYRSMPFLAVRDARVISRTGKEEILKTNFMLVARDRIICIMPRADTVMNWEVFQNSMNPVVATAS